MGGGGGGVSYMLTAMNCFYCKYTQYCKFMFDKHNEMTRKETMKPKHLLLLLSGFSFLPSNDFVSIFYTLTFIWFWGSPSPN